MSRVARSVVLALALGLLAGALAPAADAAGRCPASQKGELARSGGGVLWSRGGALYLCTAAYGDPAVTKRIGPWTKRSKLAFDGSSVVWTVRAYASNGEKEDRLWAADGPTKLWMRALRPTVGNGSAIDVKVSRLAVDGQAAAWVTTQGALVMARESDAGDTPEPVGAGSPGAAAPVVPPGFGLTGRAAELLNLHQGLLSKLRTQGRRVLIGRWTALKGPAFADTLQLENVGGDGDECGGVTDYRATVEPVAGSPRVGATWASYWTSQSAACS